MSSLDQDARLNRRLRYDRPGRRFLANEEAQWGELILPAPNEGEGKSTRGLRLLLFASMGLGLAAVKAVVCYERHFPEKLNLVGLVTDDAANADAKISLKKRGWRFFAPEERLALETATVKTALEAGTPVYTGEVKIDWFYRQAMKWDPDAILVCGFGQLIDAKIQKLPPLGIYNFHPSDLVGHHGAGPAPFEDLAARQTTRTRWTVHQLTDVLDGGPVVGQSPEIEVGSAEGSLHSDPLLIEAKMTGPLGYLLRTILDRLAERRESAAAGPLGTLDFAASIPEAGKAAFLRPITETTLPSLQQEPDPAIFA